MVNPTKFGFESVDHNRALRYEIGFFGDTISQNPISLHAYSPTTFQQAGNSWVNDLIKPLFGLNLYLRVRIIVAQSGSEIASPWSDVSNVFDFTPSTPTLVRVI